MAIGTVNSRKPCPHLDSKGKGERWMLLGPHEGLREESHPIKVAVPEQCSHWQNHREWRKSPGGINGLTSLLSLLPTSSLPQMLPLGQSYLVTHGKGA